MKLKLIIFLVILLLLPLSVNAQREVIFLAQREEEFLKHANEFKIIVVAEVIKLYPSPRSWSGIILPAQNVEYKVISTLKGKVAENKIIAGHLLYKNNYEADEEIPQLSQRL
jgi:hypothetical protein